MSAFIHAAAAIDRLGGRRWVARAATAAYRRKNPGQSFSVDHAGRWVNQQSEATVVSPIIHTTTYPAFRNWVIEHWCHAAMPGPGDTVIDVGAGVGEEAIVFSHMVGPTGKVIAIEAHPGTFRCLEETIRRSGLANVVPLGVAVGDREGTARISGSDNFLTNSIVVGRDRDDMVDVPLRTLDAVADELGLGEVALLKMNIEGAETAAIAGMARLAARTRAVVISCHDFLADRGDDAALRTREPVRELLTAQGFAVTTRTGHAEDWVRDNLYGAHPG